MPLEQITSVEQLVARFENSTLDFKTNYDLACRQTRRNIAVDVVAFANAFGGTIVVGVCERAGRIERIDGVANVPRLLKETATALQQFCVPVPRTPEENAFTVTPADAGRLLARGATAPSADVTIVTLYIRPDPRGPIGVCAFPKGAETEGMADLYRFPVRIDDQTRPLDPTELPMWMNSHERRIAIRLRAIPQGSVVQTFEEGTGSTWSSKGSTRSR